jgi:outer membrane murein-binding lipoprotein Lpp
MAAVAMNVIGEVSCKEAAMNQKMMAVVAALALGGMLLTGCSQTAKKIDNEALQEEFENAPEWVLTGHVKETTSAVGSARIGKGGLQFARTEALAAARDELARQLSVKVETLINNFAQQTGIGNDQMLDAFSKQVSRQITNETLAGSRQQDIWISPSADVYVLVVLEDEQIKNTVRREMVSSYRQDEARWQEFKAKNGAEELDRELDRAFGGR